jgi:hypothetical protein
VVEEFWESDAIFSGLIVRNPAYQAMRTDAHGRVALDISFKQSDFVISDALRRRHSVPTAQLAIPSKA